MKLIHIADLHLGKLLHQYSLIDIQKDLLDQLINYIEEHQVDGLLLAGDIYDRAIPPLEAVELLNQFLSKLIIHLHIPVYMISGNHDSNERLNFVSSILEEEGLYIETKVKEEIRYIEKENVRIYLLPYVKPIDLKNIDEKTPTHSYNEAISYYMEKQVLDHSYKNILITHGFIGFNPIRSESELTLSVGGSEVIDPNLFNEFDYVALGHLHAPQKVKEHIRYAGSLYKYSFSETNQNKGFIEIDTDTMTSTFIPFKLKQDVLVLKDSYENFMKNSYEAHKNDLISIQLVDKDIIPHAIDQLRILYPHILELTYPSLMSKEAPLKKIEKIERSNLLELYKDFYQTTTNTSLDEEKTKIMKGILETHETH